MTGERIAAGIAAYNAAATVGSVVARARRHLRTVLVADDGSTDGTAEVAARAGATVIRMKTNRGKGEALRTLFAEARRLGCSAIITLDADGQHDPDLIPAFLARHAAEPEVILTGSRFGAADHIPRDRRNSMTVARFFVSLAANQFVEDSQCGFRLYPLALLEALPLVKDGYVTETELLMKAGDSGRAIRHLPIGAYYPPGHPTHFRAVGDVAAISRYVISYLMVKWGIEALRPGTVHTYRGPGTGRDYWTRSRATDSAFEWLAVVAALPLTAAYLAWHAIGRWTGRTTVASLRLSGLGLGTVLVSVWLLPVLLVLSLLELLLRRLGARADLTSGFVARRYAYRWPSSTPSAR